jgi:HEAT repeat protein
MDQYEIFISYRRSDSAGHARALHRDLCRYFDEKRVFFDRESIESGDNFPDRLREALQQCKVVLPLIAPGWLDATDKDGRRRLENEGDFVRQEIALAIQGEKKIIPVLFDDAPMPASRQLPEDLKGLGAFDALTLRGKEFEYDAQLAELVRIISGVPGIAGLPTEAGQILASLEKHRIDYIEHYQHATVLGDDPADLLTDVTELPYVQRTFEEVSGPSQESLLHRPQPARSGKTGQGSKGSQAEPSSLPESFFLELLRGSRVSVLVEGEGGSGKTEFARHMAFRLAELLSTGSSEPERIPVLFELGAFTEQELKSSGTFLASLSERSGYLAQPLHGSSPFQSLLEEGRLVLLLDGLDEFRDAGMFEEFDRVLEEAQRYTALGKCSLLVTGRPAAFGGTPRLRRSAKQFRFRPSPIEAAGVEKYIGEFFGHEQEASAYQLIQAVQEAKDSVRRMLSWPFFLTLTCIYWQAGDTVLLSAPTELMHRAIERLLSRRLQGRVERTLKDLMQLARFSCPTFDVIPHEEAARLVEESSLEAYARDSGILRGDVANGYRFGIRPLAEYVAGRAFAEEPGDAGVAAIYRQHVWSAVWREPLYWMTGELWRKGRAELAVRLLESLLEEVEAGRDDLSETLFLRACDLIGAGGERSQLPDPVFEKLSGLVLPSLDDAEESDERLDTFSEEIRAWPEPLRDRLARRVLERADRTYNHIVAGALGILASKLGIEKLQEFLGPGCEDGDRQAAVSALGSIRDERVLKILAGLLDPESGSDEVIREMGARSLGHLGFQAAIPSLLAYLDKEEDSGVRAEVYKALGKLGWEGLVPRLEAEIRQAREDPQQWTYPEQFSLLLDLPTLSNPNAIPALERYADPDLEGDLYLQYRAGKALGRISNLTILLPREIEEPDLDVAYEFTGLAEEVGNTLVRDQHSTADGGSDPAQPGGPVHPLGTIIAVTVRVSILMNGPRNSYYLMRIDEPDPERCFDFLRGLDVEESASRASIIKAIGSCGSVRATESLIDCLQKESHANVLYQAVEAIAKLGDKAAVPPMRRLLDPNTFPDDDLCWHAAEALLQIDPADPEIVAACIDFGMPETVSRAFRNLDQAVFCVESDRLPEQFPGVSVLSQPLEADPTRSCVMIERTLLHLGHQING